MLLGLSNIGFGCRALLARSMKLLWLFCMRLYTRYSCQSMHLHYAIDLLPVTLFHAGLPSTAAASLCFSCMVDRETLLDERQLRSLASQQTQANVLHRIAMKVLTLLCLYKQPTKTAHPHHSLPTVEELHIMAFFPCDLSHGTTCIEFLRAVETCL